MDSSVLPKDEIWFLHLCHHISNAVYRVHFIVLCVVNTKFHYCFGICVHNLSCILVFIEIHEYLYSSYSAFVWIHFNFGVDGSHVTMKCISKKLNAGITLKYSGHIYFLFIINPLTPNDPYSGRTAPLTSKCCILYIYSTNVGTEYFKHGIYCPFFPLQNAVCFIILTYLVPVLFTFYIQVC